MTTKRKLFIITLLWVLESVVAGEKLPMRNYLLQGSDTSSIPPESGSSRDVYGQRLSEQAQLMDIARIPADSKSGLQGMILTQHSRIVQNFDRHGCSMHAGTHFVVADVLLVKAKFGVGVNINDYYQIQVSSPFTWKALA